MPGRSGTSRHTLCGHEKCWRLSMRIGLAQVFLFPAFVALGLAAACSSDDRANERRQGAECLQDIDCEQGNCSGGSCAKTCSSNIDCVDTSGTGLACRENRCAPCA